MKKNTCWHNPLSCRMLCGVLPLLLLACIIPTTPVLAYQSFTISLSAYQGIQLSSGMTAFDPTVLTVIIGDASDIDRIAAPDIDPLFEFSPDIDVYFGLTTNANAPVEIMAGAVSGMAVIENTGFSDITDSLLGSLDFTDRAAAVDDDDLVALRMADGTTLFLEQITKHPDATVTFTYWTPDTTLVPEPGMLALIGVGMLVVVHFIKRKHT